MLARRQELNTQIQQLIDSFLLGFSLFLAHTLRDQSTSWFDLHKSIDPFGNYWWLVIVIMIFGPILLDLQGFYESPIDKTKGKSFAQVMRAMIYLSIIVSACVIFLRLPLANRSVPLLFIGIGTGILLVKERIILQRIRRKAMRGEIRERVLLAGVREDIDALELSFTPEQTLLLEVADRIDIEKQPLSDLVEAMHRHSVARVIFAAGHSQLNRVEEAIGACEVEGVPAWLVADFIRTSIAKPDFDAFGGRPMLVFRSTPEVSWTLFVKEVIDRVGAFVALVLLAIPMMIVALLIRITSRGPVIFRQLRAGKYGKPFVMYKFRSMSNDAEMRRAELEPFNQMHGPVFKVEEDPRITPFGRWLRRTSVDEVPQLVNVLMGDMSLVGPRPLPLYEVEKFENTAQRRRLSVKPGLTCLWQISGRNQVRDFRDWVKLDLDYIDRWSLGLDFKILLRTIPAVIMGLGAK
ncbi:MAG TPA: sugar transferase [Chthoniobacterales bacterium]|jgi:exopolysaccharide biosynthesis polyprenyl glycosylphosphotransferase|nr:sugar transferase [Chthoniobacterales bacterium]